MTGVLAFETATDACSVAVSSGGVLSVRHRVAPRQHGALLFRLLEELVPGGDLRAHGIQVIAYGSGPGSFTGLRIAASVAQGLAFSSRLPAVAVSTLAVLAQTALRSGFVDAAESVLCTLDARADEVYGAVFAFEGGLAREREGPWACPPTDLVPRYPGSMAAVGNGCRYLDRFSSELRSRIHMTAPDLLPCAGDMIAPALERFARGDIQSPSAIQPVYVRDEIHWKKLAEQGKRK